MIRKSIHLWKKKTHLLFQTNKECFDFRLPFAKSSATKGASNIASFDELQPEDS